MILQRSGVRLESLWGHRGTTSWHMKVTLGALWLHFGVTLEQFWAHRRRMAGIMGVVASLMVSLSAPGGSINRKIHILRRILFVKQATMLLEEAINGASRSDF